MKKMRYLDVSADILKETDKAFQLNIRYWIGWDNHAHEVALWAPKSCCKVVDGKVVEIAEFIIDEYQKKHPRIFINYLFNPCDVKKG